MRSLAVGGREFWLKNADFALNPLSFFQKKDKSGFVRCYAL
jgi:hypothetical protein